MKAKLNIDKKAIQEFFLLHSEKIVLAGAALGFVVIVYSALMGRDSFARTPEELTQAADVAKRNYQNTSVEAAIDIKETLNSSQTVDRGPFKETFYNWDHAWDRPIFERHKPPGDPPLFTVEALRGAAGVGAFEMAEEGRRGQRWVVLTALVSLKKQEDALEECFGNAEFLDHNEKLLEYGGYLVQRAEVTGSDAAGKLSWTTHFNSFKQTNELIRKWAPRSQEEQVEAKFKNDVITLRLPPLVGRPWDGSIAHVPEIPLKGLKKERSDEDPTASAEPGPEEDVGEDPFSGETPAESPAVPPAETEGSDPIDTEEEIASPLRLFRWFDCDVKPGKRYRYRVRLALRNPSYGVKPHLLLKPESSKQRFLVTRWSDPSDIVFVPRDTRVLAVSVKSPPRRAAPPSGRMLIVKFDMAHGKEVYEEFPVFRGQVLNFVGQNSSREKGTTRSEGRENGSSQQRETHFQSDLIALDMRGGRRRNGRSWLEPPGEILLLDQSGKLLVHNQLDDLGQYVAYTAESPEDVQDGGDTRSRGAPDLHFMGDGLSELHRFDERPKPKRPKR